MNTRAFVLAGLILLTTIGLKAFYDVYHIRYPSPVINRQGVEAKRVILSWEKSIQLAAVYDWTLFGSDSEFINKQVMNETRNAGDRWNKLIPPEERQEAISAFAEENQIDVDPWVWEKNIKDYTSINDFFSRRYSEDAIEHPRHLFDASDATAINAIAESKVVAYRNVQEGQRFWIKSEAFTLAHTGLPDWQNYADHPMVIFRLAPYDYHRFHAPFSGTVVHVSSSRSYADTWSHSVKPLVHHNPQFNILNENRRRFLVIKSEFGNIALMFVGAVTVDSIVFSPEIQEGHPVKKGDDLGTFYFGGSTIVMFTDSDQLQIDEDIIQQSEAMIELQVRCGEVIGGIHRTTPATAR